MKTHDWQFFMSRRHKRTMYLWQSFFASWGLMLTTILIASSLIVKNVTWTLLDAVNIDSFQEKNMNMKNLNVKGTDQNGEPFSMGAKNAFQKFSDQDIIYFDAPTANIVNMKNGKKVNSKITANSGKLDNAKHKVTLNGNVRIKSSDGSTVNTQELEIKLK